MTRLMPTGLLPIAGMLALGIAWPRRHAPTSSPRLFAEVFAFGIGTIAACAGVWARSWLAEPRW